MGLAASQARLLMLTSRKDDVEGQLMNIANQKLALSRQSASLSDDYDNALKATNYAWKTDNGNVDLSYNLLMRPNMTNAAGQYIITDATNDEVILDNKYVSDLGIQKSGSAGDLASAMTQQQFLMKLIGCSQDAANGYVNGTGSSTTTPTFTTNYNDSDAMKNLLTMSDVPVSLGTDSGTASASLDTTLTNIENGVAAALKPLLLPKLGNSNACINGLSSAFDYAYKATYNKFYCDQNDTNSKDGVQLGSSLVLGQAGSNQVYQKSGTYYVDGSQLIKTYLAYFDQYCAQNFGGSTSSSVGSTYTSRGSYGGTGTTTAITGGNNNNNTSADVNNNGIADSYEASFYLNLYSALNSSGWRTADDAQNPNFFESEMSNGNIAIKQMQSDGSWAKASANGYNTALVTTTDDQAATKAEAAYDAKKDLLDSKEEQLDLTMNNLDTERSSITTEIDSINSLIKKRIETGFKMFDA